MASSNVAVKKTVDAKTGVGIGLTFLCISAFLFAWPDYFLSATLIVQAFFLFFGLAGTGSDLDRLAKGDFISSNEHRFANIFNNFGLGLAMILAWAFIVGNFPGIYGRIIAFLPFIAGVTFLCYGLVNSMYAFYKSTPKLGTDNTESLDTKAGSFSVGLWRFILACYIVINSLVALGASILTIMSILKLI